MDITFNTPALLFPAISLLLLVYGNRFLSLAGLIRKLHDEYMAGKKNKIILRQIHNLRRRIHFIRLMQALAVLSFVCCVVSMYFIYWGLMKPAGYIFGLSLLSLLISLLFSLAEIFISTKALELELSDIEGLESNAFFSGLITGQTDKKEE